MKQKSTFDQLLCWDASRHLEIKNIYSCFSLFAQSINRASAVFERDQMRPVMMIKMPKITNSRIRNLSCQFSSVVSRTQSPRSKEYNLFDEQYQFDNLQRYCKYKTLILNSTCSVYKKERLRKFQQTRNNEDNFGYSDDWLLSPSRQS